MSVKELEAIKKAEIKTESILKKAHQQGEKVVEEAKRVKDKEVKKTREDAKQIVTDSVKSAKKESQPQIRAILDKTDLHKKEIFLHSQKQYEKAVKLILERILG